VVGLLIMSKGTAVKVGLLLSAMFQLFLAPTGEWGIANVLLAFGCLMLLQVDYHRNILEVFSDRLQPQTA
jgi:hypothetical protein